MIKSLQIKENLNWEKIILVCLFFFFIVQAIFFVFFLADGIVPDERYHYGVSIAFSKVLGIPRNTAETFTYGDITHMSYLFFWINGRVLNLTNWLSINSLIVLRLVGTLYSLLTIVFVWLSSKEIIKKKYLRLLPVFLLVTTMMFTFLGGAISYDTLTNCLAAGSMWALIKVFKNDKDLKWYLVLFIFWLLSALTKITVLPLIAFEFIAVAIFVIKNRSWKIKPILRKKEYILIALLVLFSFLAGLLYLGNLFKYHSLTPSCIQVMTEEDCSNNFIYTRSLEYEAAGVASREGYRIRELLLLDLRMNPFDFFFDWEAKITPRLYGIFGHQSIVFPRNFEFIYTVLFGMIALMFTRYVNKKNLKILALSFVSISYVLVIAYLVHYKSYLKMNSLNIAMQGRYLLPVMPTIYLIIAWTIKKVPSKIIRRLLIASFVVVFLAGSVYIFYRSIIEGGSLWYPSLFD